jgi:hypothetical protein
MATVDNGRTDAQIADYFLRGSCRLLCRVRADQLFCAPPTDRTRGIIPGTERRYARVFYRHIRVVGRLAALVIAQHEQADRIFMHRRPRAERPDLPQTGGASIGTTGDRARARRSLCGCVVCEPAGRGSPTVIRHG